MILYSRDSILAIHLFHSPNLLLIDWVVMAQTSIHFMSKVLAISAAIQCVYAWLGLLRHKWSLVVWKCAAIFFNEFQIECATLCDVHVSRAKRSLITRHRAQWVFGLTLCHWHSVPFMCGHIACEDDGACLHTHPTRSQLIVSIHSTPRLDMLYYQFPTAGFVSNSDQW